VLQNTGSNDYLIQRLMEQLCFNSGIHICIHYLSGTFQGNKTFEISPENTIHRNAFCDAAKTTPKGLHFCIMNKSCSVKKAIKLGRTYAGKCYLGITEIVSPVYYDGRPFCIMYIGNLAVQEDLEHITNRIRKKCRITGVSEELLLEKLRTTEPVNSAGLDRFIEMVNVLSSVIRLCIAGSTENQKKNLPGLARSEETIHWIVRQVIHYIENYYNTAIKLSLIANLYNMNHQYLCRLFKKETGENFSGYLNRIRVENAARLLESTDESILEIALSVGFNSPSYFDAVFRKHHSVAPYQYRKIKKQISQAQNS